MVMGILKRSSLACISMTALMAASGCTHTRLAFADAGGGSPGLGAAGSGGGGASDESAASDSSSTDNGGGDTAGGSGGTGGDNSNGGAEGDNGGGGTGDGATGTGSEPLPATPQAGGLTQLTGLVGGTVGSVVYASGNTLKATPAPTPVGQVGEKLAGIGGDLRQDGLAGTPVIGQVIGPVVGNVTGKLDAATSPVAKITLIGTSVAGSGAGDSTQLVGLTAGSTAPVQGTSTSVNLLNNGGSGAVASADVAGGNVAGATVLANGLLNPAGTGAVATASVANGQIVSTSILPNGAGVTTGGLPGVASLANVSVGGQTLIADGNAAVNVNALPGGNLAAISDVANLNTILAPVATGHLAPVVGAAQSAVTNVSGNVESAPAAATGAAAGAVGATTTVVGASVGATKSVVGATVGAVGGALGGVLGNVNH